MLIFEMKSQQILFKTQSKNQRTKPEKSFLISGLKMRKTIFFGNRKNKCSFPKLTTADKRKPNTINGNRTTSTYILPKVGGVCFVIFSVELAAQTSASFHPSIRFHPTGRGPRTTQQPYPVLADHRRRLLDVGNLKEISFGTSGGGE